MQNIIMQKSSFQNIISKASCENCILFYNDNGIFKSNHNQKSHQFTSNDLPPASALHVTLETRVPLILNHVEDSFIYNNIVDNPFEFNIQHLATIPCLLDEDTRQIWGIVLLSLDNKSDTIFHFDTIRAIYQDLSLLPMEHKEIQAFPIESTQILEDKIEYSYQFFSSIIHDMRTPINIIMGFLDLLNKKLANDIEGKEYIHAANRSADMISALVDDVLDFTKVDLGKLELNMHYFSIMEEFESIVTSFYYITQKKEIDFRVYFDPLSPYIIYSDAHRIKQIINNLISNALKFTPENGQIILDFNYNQKNDMLNIEVTDTGIGMSKKEVDNIFQPFKQASKKTSSQYGGTGLGLSISKQIASILGAELSVKSIKGEGTTFTLQLPCHSILGTPPAIQLPPTLPTIYLLEGAMIDELYHLHIKRYLNRLNLNYLYLKPEELKEKSHTENNIYMYMQKDKDLSFINNLHKDIQSKLILIEKSVYSDTLVEFDNIITLYRPVFPTQLLEAFTKGEKNVPSTNKSITTNKKLKILIADDSIINLKLMKEILKPYASKLYTANNGKEAYEAFLEKDLDIIIIDEHMPKMKGSQVIKKIRINKDGGKLYICSLTGDSDSKIIKMIEKAGANLVLTKPIRNSAIEKMIANY